MFWLFLGLRIPDYITNAADLQAKLPGMDDQQLCNPAIALKSEEAQGTEEDNGNSNEDNEVLEQHNQTTNQCSMPR